ncbi:MAG: PDZ domain-containing protein [Planctomycetes bacterium]|nr:PDZ domain-containing protein [Planctomycetota bacterium]
MGTKSKKLRNWIHLIIWILAAIFAVHLISENLRTTFYILIVALGFGAVIMIHEFGHFIVAKVSGIKVDAFSIGFPPVLIGVQRIEDGIRIRILPTLVNKNAEKPEEGGIVFTVGKKGKASDTEYRVGLIPFGGFVAMMGQSDSGAVEETDDPRSFTNKPIMIRIAVVAAGVIFNAISAVVIFMAVFLVGLELAPAEVGGVVANSPAEIAGMQPGDRIVEVDGERFVDFMSLPMAAALSAKGEEVNLIVEREGVDEPLEFNLVAKVHKRSPIPVRAIGIQQASTLRITDQLSEEDAKLMYESTGLKAGDIVKAVNGVKVEKAWQLNELVESTLDHKVHLNVKRQGVAENVSIELPLMVMPDNSNFETGFDVAHVHTMVPRLKIYDVVRATKKKQKFLKWWRKTALKENEGDLKLKVGDIILKIGEVENPTYTELREVTKEHKDKEMVIRVLREDKAGVEQETEVIVTPRQMFTRNGDGPVNIGIIPELDVEHAIVAKTIDLENGPSRLAIPSGATIVAVDGEKVSDFYDVIRVIRHNRGQRISVDYRMDDQEAGSVVLDIPSQYDFITTKTQIDAFVPFDQLRELYKASGPIEAVGMGFKKTKMFIVQTVMTLKRLFSGAVSPTTLSGPLGIVTASYSIASQSMAYYIYFLGLISSCIAVMNLLPLPIVDGGVIVLLIVEKIKGSPLSQKVQGIISYVGLVFILGLFGWLLWNDFLNMLLQ